MTEPNRGTYTFLPWVKTGLGALISNNEQDMQGPRAKIQVDLSVRRFDNSNKPWPDDEQIVKEFFLYGPGDIAGILNSIIIRTEPRANDVNVEPNYFPFIEFSQPDFPWRYTPAVPIGTQPSGRLSPWISLIVLKEQEFNRLVTEPGLLPQIEISDPASSLPDLEQSWGWAHTQITKQIPNPESLKETLSSQPHSVISRILSLRKLEPNVRYFAFLVPTFEVGRLAGLGDKVDADIRGTAFAWRIGGSPSENSPLNHRLPVYYQWQFNTSLQKGDFESLVRRLEGRQLSETVGLRKLDVSEPFLSVGKEKGFEKPLYFGGVLCSPRAKELITNKKINVRTLSIPGSDPENPSPEEIKDFIMEMKELIDLGERLTWSFAESPSFSNECNDPIISPPMYGKWLANKKLISKISNDNKDPEWIASLTLDPSKDWLEKLRRDPQFEWIEQLNLDPTNRAAAGFGVAVIQEHQEELMESAWDQDRSLKEKNKVRRLAQLSLSISENIFYRDLRPMEPSVFIRVVSPLHYEVTHKDQNNEKSVKTLISESPIPNAIFSPSFTKIIAKRGIKRRRLFDGDSHISFNLLGRLNVTGSNRDLNLDAVKLRGLLTIDHLVNSPVLQEHITEDDFRGVKVSNFLSNDLISESIRNMIKNIENSIPVPESIVLESHGVVASLNGIYDALIRSLDPVITIQSKVEKEVMRPERLVEDKKDKLDPIVAYPEFRRPMFEPLRNLSEELLLPGIRDIPPNTISLLETNSIFINSYMVGLNHEMAKELLWREYPTDQRGSYFRQFWDASAAIHRDRLEYFHKNGHFPPESEDEKIIEKYRDIPEIHKWKDSPLEEIHKWKDSTPEEVILRAQKAVLLIKGELLMRYPGAIIYASKAKFDTNNSNRIVLPPPTEGDEQEQNKQIILPVFRGTISPDITFLGFDMSLDELCGIPENTDPGYFFMILEQPSEPRFGIDEGGGGRLPTDPPIPPSFDSWDALTWDHVTLSSGSNNNVDLDNGPLKGKQISKVTWGSHAADLANILLQRPVRMAVHARELAKKLKNVEDDGP
jgi:hypothetical protein